MVGVSRPRSGKMILQAEMVMSQSRLREQGNDQHALAADADERQPVQTHGGLLADGPLRQGDLQFALPRGKLPYGTVLTRGHHVPTISGRSAQPGLDPELIDDHGRIAAFVAEFEHDFRDPPPRVLAHDPGLHAGCSGCTAANSRVRDVADPSAPPKPPSRGRKRLPLVARSPG